mmetsp:Transcript_15000/g.41912  ORF Transcript_15000/g.41912 Transcript_15000/m.41912 type:complete len:147 (-) Transcript_15000:181-621(-)
MGAVPELARAILEQRMPYLVGQIVVKAVTILAVFLVPQGPGHTVPVLACATAAAADVALRVAASRRPRLSPGKHGADLLLVCLLLADAAACGGEASAGGKACRALRMVVPFATLVSLGGNAMRLTARQRAPGDAVEQDCEAVGVGE